MRLSHYIPCRYSRFIFFTGAGICTGLLLCSAMLYGFAPCTSSTAAHLNYINMGKSCIDSSLAVLVSTMISVSIGESIFRGKS